MRRLLLAAVCTALFALPLGAQEANRAETQAVNEIVQCLVEGLPSEWVSAHMVVELATPGGSTGGVRYLFSKKEGGGELEPFTPCDSQTPANILIELRRSQSYERRNWTGARLVLQRDGSFRLNYDFPK